ncbi:SDR family NAD(P)-dependent oxidoreductase [Amycolatopsis magusensis]|uniref:NAD(P)-dependent dehydrogenase (Short-subunit alcohol dehydrogenase family) n=1 Tax=Amycolatopsis magusensis TaxID=882444 RepID=A0ABS4PX99_9PSEU|nr:SDR family oxidoreductase [Amycolatopsis magusensis]MBP2184047.1 NAD(P)-dependent dehydrogenase (short-subunit alcohol dehydrogenase family) [Amycolatopsis magusensis]
MSPGLAGRTALVTGGGSGLGRAMCLALSAAGARVIAAGRRQAAVTETVDLLDTPGRAAVVDVGDPESVRALAADLDGEQVDVLVNNAGVPGPVRNLVDVEPGEWDEVFAVNVRGTYLMCRAFLPPMVAAGRGDVINVASVSGKRPLAARTPYCASKMAVLGLTTTLAAEVGPHGVMVNSLSPGPVDGPRMERNFRLEAERSGISSEQAEQAFVSRAALGRMVTEAEVGAALVAMLGMPGLCAADIDLSAGMVAR